MIARFKGGERGRWKGEEGGREAGREGGREGGRDGPRVGFGHLTGNAGRGGACQLFKNDGQAGRVRD